MQGTERPGGVGRRCYTALVSAAAALLLLAGCASAEIPKLEAPPATSAQTSQTTVTTAAPETETETETTTTTSAPAETTTAAAPEEPEDVPEALPTAPPPDPDEEVYAQAEHIPGLRLDPTETDGIYELAGLPEENPEIEYHDGIVLTFSPLPEDDENSKEAPDARFAIKAYDIGRGLLLGETDTFETGYSCYTPDTCGSYEHGFYSCVTNKVRLMDIGLNVTDILTLPIVKCTRLWMEPGGRYILCNDKRGPTVLYDVENRTGVELSRLVKASSVIACDGESFDIVTKKGERFRIMTSGTVTPLGALNFPDIYLDRMNDLDGRVIDIVPAGIFVNKPYQSAKLIKYPPRKIHYILSLDDRYLTFADEDDKTRVFDTDKGMVSEPIGFGAYAVRGSGGDGSFVFLDNENWNGSTRYLLAVPSELKYKKKAETEVLDPDKDEYKLYFDAAAPSSERAAILLKELRERYNVRVFFSPVSEKEKYFGYCCKAYKGEQADILESLRNFLAMSPPQILTESTPTGAETWIFICSEIVDDHELSVYGTAAFASAIGLHPFVALETPLNEKKTAEAGYFSADEKSKAAAKFITDNFSHEFIHLLDAKTTDSQNEKWRSLSPEGCYLDSYTGDGGNRSEYVDFSKEFDNNVYFTDYYAKVNDLEDKARTGENLYYARTGEVTSKRELFARSESLYNKARALCGIFRENYPCLAGVPEGEWYLEKPLLGSYKEMKNSWKKDKKQNPDKN